MMMRVPPLLLQILFLAWVSSDGRYVVILGERRSIQRQGPILNENCCRFRDDETLCRLRAKCRQLTAVVGQPQQLVGVPSVAAMVFFLANRHHSELPEADGLGVG